MDGNLATNSGNHDGDSFIGRDYQVQLLSIAEKENTILFLPTGSGKTFVAVMLIKSMSKDLEKPYKEGGKRTFFAVNTVALVTQQGDYIARHTHLSVGKYSGDLNVDNWNANRWEEELNKNQVIVLTCQILLDMLCHGFISLENINLIIFDECHHAVADHCMRRVMQKFEKCPKEQQPRVLGLSATLLNSNCKARNVRKEIETLEITFQSKVATVDDINLVKRFATNPIEDIIMFHEGYPENAASCVPSLKADVIEELKAALTSLKSVDCSMFSLDNEKSVPSISPKLRRMNSSFGEREKKRLGSILNDVQVILEDLGIFGGYIAALYANILLHRRKLSMNTAEGKLIISSLITHLTLVRKIIHDKIEEHEPLEQVFKFSTIKVLKLIDLIKAHENPVTCGDSVTLEKLLQQKKESLTSKPSCLIFVERRQTAKTLYQILKHVAQHSVQLKNVRPDFVVGIASNPASMESAASVRNHHEAIKRFRLGECNYLIASDVMEEGVDIPLCAMVVKLDIPKTFRSYVQSKGRARHSSSKFFMFVSTANAKFEKNLEEYRRIEVILKQILVGKSELREGPSEEDVKYNLYCQDIPPYYSDDNSSSVSIASASSLINRYCSLLPQDKFTQLQPIWALQELCVSSLSPARRLLSNNHQDNTVNLKLAFLQLPMNSPIRNIIKGIPMPNKRLAKRAVAIIACAILHRKKELGKNDLLPVCHKPEALDDAILFPHWIDEKDSSLIPGTKKAKRMYQKEVSKILSFIHPKPNVPTYVYHIFQTPTFDAPSPKDSRGTAIYHVLNMKRGFAILSSEKLPRVCDFSIYMSSGEIAVTIEPEHEEIILSAIEIEELELFHAMLFLDLLNICKQFFTVDKTDNENAYLIAPTRVGSDGKWIIDWDVVKNFPLLPPVLPLSLEEKENLTVDNKNFLYEVVTPWYRGCYAEQHYVVTQVCEDLTSRSEFPSKTYESFEQYFNEKYELTLVQPEKPLLEVKKISSRIDCTHPKIIAKPFDDTPSILPLSKRQMQLKNGDFLEHLIPELVTKRHFPATLWLKATTLPTILHRFSSMQLASELRHKICVETKINNMAPPQGKWKRLEVESSEIQVCESKPLPSTFFEDSETDNSLSEPPDLDHDIDSLCLLDVVQYHKLEMKENDGQVVYKCEWSKIEPAPIPEAVFNRLKGMAVSDDGECQGPELADVLSALTGASSGDVISLERLETLGDSFLKFAVSTYMYLKYPTMDEGKLTMVKGKMISNRNLYYCGKVINLGGKMKVHPFAPQSDWTPPGFAVPIFLKEKLNSLGGITKNILFQLSIPEKERRSGHLSRDTKSDIVNFLNESQTNNMIGSTSTTLEALLGTQSVPDKSVADCVEALIGAWLVSGGGAAALRLLGWFGIFPHGREGPAGTWQDLVGKEALDMGKRGVIKDQTDYDIIGGVVDWGPNAQENTNSIHNLSEKMNEVISIRANGSGQHTSGTENAIEALLLGTNQLEESLHYNFKNKTLLLQAITHASYFPNKLTECYQRLEFLGDAVLDFLITCHIYETGGKLNPGQLTDLRSALVNNITFASLVVRHGLHRHLLYLSPSLMEAIDSFVEFQLQRGNVVTEDCLVLMEEEECCLAESVEVPKALGDIMESLAGAIFLDSGLSLTAVWQVFYPMMKNEIEAFTKKVPKQPVRELLETNAKVQFMPSEEVKPAVVGDEVQKSGVVKAIVMVPVKITDPARGQERTFFGFGENKSLAKRAAAKLALRAMGKGNNPVYTQGEI
ncbi:endoribonuclease Dicer [Hetaerina americana]|uniref:endoribonuclease Dicer n=1 Tax=Hetaerina americana TaxID=62018 RepID=UPI003A7F3116